MSVLRADPQLPTPIAPSDRLLTAAEFHPLAEVPPEIEWFANIRNRSTRRAYENAIRDFMQFTGIVRPEEFRTVTRAHVIAWRNDLARRELGGATIRHRHAALSSLFEYLCEKNAVTHNPVKGKAGAGLFSGARFRDRRPRTAGNGRHQCARPPGRHRQGAGMARPRQISPPRASTITARRGPRTARRSR